MAQAYIINTVRIYVHLLAAMYAATDVNKMQQRQQHMDQRVTSNGRRLCMASRKHKKTL